MKKRVVITGVGAVTPLGADARTLHVRWCAGDSGIEDGAGLCRDFAPEDVLSRKLVRRTDRFTQLALAAADEALAQAGWSDGLPYEPERIGCILGTGIGGIHTLLDGYDVLRERGAGSVPPLAIPLLMPNSNAAAVAMRHGIKGQTYGTTSACAAGAHAIGAATRAIQYGDADTVVTGGAEAALTPLSLSASMAVKAATVSSW